MHFVEKVGMFSHTPRFTGHNNPLFMIKWLHLHKTCALSLKKLIQQLTPYVVTEQTYFTLQMLMRVYL